MKLIFPEEDSVFGIILGLIVLGLSGKYYKVPDLSLVYGIFFGISMLLTVADIFATFTRMHRHMAITVLNWLNNVADTVLDLAFISFFFKLNIPFITPTVVPYLASPSNLYIIGIFYVASNVFWIVLHPLTE